MPNLGYKAQPFNIKKFVAHAKFRHKAQPFNIKNLWHMPNLGYKYRHNLLFKKT